LWANSVPWLSLLGGAPFGVALNLPTQRGDRVAHLFVGSTATDIAAQGFFDVGGRGLGILIEGGSPCDHEAGRAEAALLGVELGERGRYLIEPAVGVERLSGLDVLATRLQGQHRAGVDRLAVDHDRAGAASAAIADALAAGHVEIVA